MVESEAKMRNAVRIGLVLMAGAALAACGTTTPRYSAASKPGPKPDPNARSYVNSSGQKVGKPYQVGGVWYVPREQPNYDETGIASWYGPGFHMKATATGETFDMEAVSAAHTTLPLPSMVEVTNLDNGKKLVVRINDRGPFVGDRIIDLSKEAARQLGYERAGIAHVRVRYLGPPPLLGRDAGVRYAANKPTPSMTLPPVALPPVAAAAVFTPPPVEPAVIFTGSTVRAAGSIAVASLPPPMAMPPVAEASPPVVETPAAQAPIVQVSVASNLRVQAGAFASEANAQRAVSQLSLAGQATIEPMTRSDGLTLYRVTLPAPADEAEAFALRDRVAEIGFADARVVRPF